MLAWKYNDGGKRAAGFKGKTRDCVCRSIAIAAELSYQSVYDGLIRSASTERLGKRKTGISHPRTGIHKATIRRYMKSIGWVWVPTMFIGSGCKVHLRDDELPTGRLVVSVSKHTTAVINGIIHDTFDPTRDGTRCVYGYFHNEGGE